MLVPSDKINREVSTLEARKPMESKKSLRQVYYALDACFKPYNNFVQSAHMRWKSRVNKT
jgi:hypothetical protein